MIWIFLLGAAGLTIVISLSKVAAPVRRIYPPLLECPLCTGTWVGLGTGAFLAFRDKCSPAAVSVAEALAFAFAAALVAYVAGTWLREHDVKHE